MEIADLRHGFTSLAAAMPAQQVGHRHAALRLSENADDLAFTELGLPHGLLLTAVYQGSVYGLGKAYVTTIMAMTWCEADNRLYSRPVQRLVRPRD